MSRDFTPLLDVPPGCARIVHLDGTVEEVLGEPTPADLRALLRDNELDLFPISDPISGKRTRCYIAHTSVALAVAVAAAEAMRPLIEKPETLAVLKQALGELKRGGA